MTQQQHNGYDDRLLEFAMHPPGGWIRSKRTKMGITGSQLASKLGVTKQRVSALEKAEVNGSASIKTMRQAAAAMGCEFVYALIPARAPARTAPATQIDAAPALSEQLQSPAFKQDLAIICRHFEITHLGIEGSPAHHDNATDTPLHLIAEYSGGQAPLPAVRQAIIDAFTSLFARAIQLSDIQTFAADIAKADHLRLIYAS